MFTCARARRAATQQYYAEDRAKSTMCSVDSVLLGWSIFASDRPIPDSPSTRPPRRASLPRKRQLTVAITPIRSFDSSRVCHPTQRQTSASTSSPTPARALGEDVRDSRGDENRALPAVRLSRTANGVMDRQGRIDHKYDTHLSPFPGFRSVTKQQSRPCIRF